MRVLFFKAIRRDAVGTGDLFAQPAPTHQEVKVRKDGVVQRYTVASEVPAKARHGASPAKVDASAKGATISSDRGGTSQAPTAGASPMKGQIYQDDRRTLTLVSDSLLRVETKAGKINIGLDRVQVVDAVPADVAKAMRGMTFSTIMGKQTMRKEDNQLEAPNFFGVVTDRGGKLRPVIQTAVPAAQALPAPDPACKLPA